MRSIRLTYKCSCFKEEVSFECAERRPDEDVLDYMSFVQMVVGVDHRNRSPLCQAKALEYLKMPIADGKGIGEVEGGNA